MCSFLYQVQKEGCLLFHFQSWNSLVESLRKKPKVLEAECESFLRRLGWVCQAALYYFPAGSDWPRLSFFLCGRGTVACSCPIDMGHGRPKAAHQQKALYKCLVRDLSFSAFYHPPGHPSPLTLPQILRVHPSGRNWGGPCCQPFSVITVTISQIWCKPWLSVLRRQRQRDLSNRMAESLCWNWSCLQDGSPFSLFTDWVLQGLAVCSCRLWPSCYTEVPDPSWAGIRIVSKMASSKQNNTFCLCYLVEDFDSIKHFYWTLKNPGKDPGSAQGLNKIFASRWVQGHEPPHLLWSKLSIGWGERIGAQSQIPHGSGEQESLLSLPSKRSDVNWVSTGMFPLFIHENLPQFCELTTAILEVHC